MTSTLRYTFEMLTDWHAGTGAGRSGDVDRLVARDDRGWPYLPAKTVTGVWRDAAERLATALDAPHDDARWAALVDELFGDQPSRHDATDATAAPRPARVSIRPARYSAELQARLGDHCEADLVPHLTTTRASTSIDPVTGVAAERTLRIIEVGRAGSRLHGEVGIDVADDDLALVVEFLTLAAGLVEGVGATRRRGLGRCRVVVHHDLSTGVDLAEAVPPDLGRTDGTVALEPPPAADALWRLDLDLDLVLPVVVRTSTSGNVVATADHPTGRLLLPVVTELAERAGIDARRLVGDGRLVVSGGRPLVDGHPADPVPFHLSREKAGAAGVERRLLTSLAASAGPADPGDGDAPDGPAPRQAKQLRSGWVRATGDDPVRVSLATVATLVRTHATIAEELQRPDESVGGVFSFEAIAPGQRFRATVVARVDQPTAQRLHDALDGADAAIGTSRKDDYGRVEITAVGPPRSVESDDHPGWRAGQHLHVWCTSDVVLLDDHLRPAPTADRLGEVVAEALGAPPDALEPDPRGVRLRVRRHDPWNARWGLPGPTVVAIAAGSVVRFDVKVDVPGGRRAELEVVGVGERRAEGFGRVRVDDPLLSAENLELETGRVDTTTGPNPSEGAAVADDDPFVGAIETAIWSDRIRRSIDDRTGEMKKRLHAREVGATQVNHLRQLLARDRRLAPDSAAVRFLERDQTQARWPKTARTEMVELLSSPEEVWHRLGLLDSSPPEALAVEAALATLERITRTTTRGAREERSRGA